METTIKKRDKNNVFLLMFLLLYNNKKDIITVKIERYNSINFVANKWRLGVNNVYFFTNILLKKINNQEDCSKNNEN